MAHTPFQTLRDQMSPEAQARAAQQADALLRTMPDTPGERCYAAYRQERVRALVLPPWDTLTPDHQYAWEAAAQAVLRQWDAWRALACNVHQALWAQIAACDCDTAHRVPVGSLCASCDSLRSIAEAATAAGSAPDAPARRGGCPGG